MSEIKRLTPKDFLNKVLAGTALGIIVGFIPNAVLASILKLFEQTDFVVLLTRTVVMFQLTTPLLIGALIALQFGLNPMKMAVVAGAAFVGSGVTMFNPQMQNMATNTMGAYVSAGTGDIINTMLTASIAVILILLVGEKFGSVSIILTPILIGAGSGLIGLLILPYVKGFTAIIGNGINSFTNLQPILMSILIACSFAVLIISPISTVAIGMAIQLNGISAGAAAMGVAATTIVLVVHSWKVNKPGLTMAVGLGAMKMMMPNLFRYPIILVPVLFTAAISAIPVALFNVMGTASSSGFGLVGLVGPLASINAGLNIILAIVVWFVIPTIASIISLVLFEKVLKLYKKEEAFAYLG
ncbi:PTS sugar transporter subunit IIC [Clostridium chauvoei]|uniref:PTS sugar transporter subunit IIC n=1 Tax=Clostridium chauvoei TaxID=46867 RepID=UPI001C8662C1|nr:PTS sugar transporter subunit IIC [Clostridium chauvoei]MBX7360779.1 PTS sugar transporter subunit IIC [Clostridium chauvoei]MBX7363250.1 PTS sugar transporter subunit IIC [Clostridium chauvoei]MBX7370925.1 PTS sugar transporter subunit IIC [Clostridium chauvoei]MBX7373500.1 PTS sugar transporter subunit IIC [Clostridium chauvoei]MBX7386054.1 PTS sugar transporter subunit IIC [Clostridium chauvoei]